jgi:hypothetical protein
MDNALLDDVVVSFAFRAFNDQLEGMLCAVKRPLDRAAV